MTFISIKHSFKAALHSRLLLSLREAFIALIPYFVSSALAILLLNSAIKLNVVTPSDDLYKVVLDGASLVLVLFPVIVAISIGFFISKNYGQSGIVGAMLALLCFSLHGQYILFHGDVFQLNPTGSTPYAVIVLCLSSLILKFFVKAQPNFDKYFHHVSNFLGEKLLIILPFTLTFFSFYYFICLTYFLKSDHVGAVYFGSNDQLFYIIFFYCRRLCCGEQCDSKLDDTHFNQWLLSL